ncbi:MAG: hypothetical protein WD267_06485 [Balneolales bacterium]
MNIVIDANVFVSYFKKEVLDIKKEDLTSNAVCIFDRLGKEDISYLDDGGHILQEWRALADPEWFETWYADSLRDGALVLVPTENCQDLKKLIYSKYGFPKSKDFWYIKVAKRLCNDYGKSYLITEDLDFFDPKKKGCNNRIRLKLLKNSSGNLAKHLKKKESIYIFSVIGYLEYLKKICQLKA